MDIQERKIHFVQEFLRINNEALIDKFEKILKAEKQKDYESSLHPYSLDEFNLMIDKAEEDSSAGRLTSSSELKNDMDSWL